MSATRLNLSSLQRRNVESNLGSSSSSSGANNVIEMKLRKKSVQKDLTDLPNLPTIPDQIPRQNYFTQSSVLTTTASGDASFPGLECLQDDFYDVPCKQLARSLLGKILVRKLESGHTLKGRVVETECYLGAEDKASHSFRGKMTERNAPMFMKPGTAYVYFTYGMYHCFNISSQGPGAAVLIRAVEPMEGLDVMAELRARGAKRKKQKKEHPEEGGEATATATATTLAPSPSPSRSRRGKPPLKPHEVCNGPSKLCIAFDIDRDTCNKRDLVSWPGLSLFDDGFHVDDDVGDATAAAVVVVTKRVGIESAGREWADAPLRFYLLGNPAVSKRDRAAEKELCN